MAIRGSNPILPNTQPTPQLNPTQRSAVQQATTVDAAPQQNAETQHKALSSKAKTQQAAALHNRATDKTGKQQQIAKQTQTVSASQIENNNQELGQSLKQTKSTDSATAKFISDLGQGITAEDLQQARAKLKKVSHHQVLNLGSLSSGTTTKESALSRKLGSELGGVSFDKDIFPVSGGTLDIVGHSSEGGMKIEGKSPQQLATFLKENLPVGADGKQTINTINLVSCESEQFKNAFQAALTDLGIEVGQVKAAQGRAAVDRTTGKMLDEAKVGDLNQIKGHDGGLAGLTPGQKDRVHDKFNIPYTSFSAKTISIENIEKDPSSFLDHKNENIRGAAQMIQGFLTPVKPGSSQKKAVPSPKAPVQDATARPKQAQVEALDTKKEDVPTSNHNIEVQTKRTMERPTSENLAGQLGKKLLELKLTEDVIEGKDGTSTLSQGGPTGTGKGGQKVQAATASLTQIMKRTDLSENEKIEILQQLNHLVENAQTGQLSNFPNISNNIIAGVMQDIAEPTTICQHAKGSCAQSVIQMKLSIETPAVYAKYMNKLVSDPGNAKMLAALGESDKSGRSLSNRLFQDHMMEGEGLSDNDFTDFFTTISGQSLSKSSVPSYVSESAEIQEKFGNLFKEMKTALDNGHTIPMSLNFPMNGDHEVLVTKMDDTNVYFLNPQGRPEYMPKIELQKRIDDRVNGGQIFLMSNVKLPAKDSPAPQHQHPSINNLDYSYTQNR